MFVFGLGMVVADDEFNIMVEAFGGVPQCCFEQTTPPRLERNGRVRRPATHSRSENSNLTAFSISECLLAMSHHCGFARWTCSLEWMGLYIGHGTQ